MAGGDVFGKLWGAWAVLAVCVLPLSCVPPSPYTFDDHVGPLPSAFMEQEVEAARAVPPPGPLKVTVQEAILMGMENNRALRVDRLNPSIQRTGEKLQEAVFDPVVSAAASGSLAKTKGAMAPVTSKSAQGEATVSKFFPTGTDVSVGATTDYSWSGDQYVTRGGVTVTQALLQGFGLDVNLASLRQARLDTLSSEYELRGFAESLLGDIEGAYWDCALAHRGIAIYQESLNLANQQLNETQERVRVGKLAETEVAAAEAEVALRREGLIIARSALDTTRLRLLRLINPAGPEVWQREIVLLSPPTVPGVKLDGVESHVELAMRMRADLNQARLSVQRGDLEVVRTRNGLLPRLDLFITLGRTGYAGSFGGSAGRLPDKYYDISAGVRLEYPLGNRAAEASHERAVLGRQQAAESLANMGQLVQVDVRSAYIDAVRSAEQVTATTATRKLQEEKVRAETEKFKVGKSTSLLVAQVQRDLLQSQIAEIVTVANHLKALIGLYRLEGSLLERRGIKAPGREPADGVFRNR